MLDSIFHTFLLFFSIFLPLAVIFYARLVKPHKFCVRTRVLLGSLIVFLVAVISLAIPISLRLARDPVAYEQYNMGTWLIVMYTVMTFVFVSLICLIIRDLCWLVGRFVGFLKKRKNSAQDVSPEAEYAAISRRDFLKRASTVATLGCAVALTPASIWHAKAGLKIRHFDIRLKNFPASLDGLRIVHLSDIHVGNTILEEDVARIVEKTNALNADLIVITGDLVDGMPEHIGSWIEPMRNFKAKYGTWFVTGNHDHLWNAKEWCRLVSELGIHVLDNAHEILDIHGTKIAIAGVIDAFGDRRIRRWKSEPEQALSGIEPEMFKLMLAHQPSSVDRSLAAGADLVLIGHTHGGQCWPVNLIVNAVHRYNRGLYELDGKAVFVSCGTGYWGPPMRFGVPPEIDVHTLYHA